MDFRFRGNDGSDLMKNIISNLNFFVSSPLFEPLLSALKKLKLNHNWPQLNDYNNLLLGNKPILSGSGAKIKFIKQEAKSKEFAQQYEPRIYLKGEVQVRENNWHDFFNTMVWLTFPKTKVVLNSIQYNNLKQRLNKSKIRNSIENALTLFDENGAVIVSCNKELIDLFKNFQWKELFWNRRKEVELQMKFFIFGHSIYEKALNPYLGMTASSVAFIVDELFLKKHIDDQLTSIDELLFNAVENGNITSPKQLAPLPILGIPGWFSDNACASYYDNKTYFRYRPKQKNAI